MRQYENFRKKEMSDGTFLIADPVQPSNEPLRMEGGWFDIEPGEEGDWEEIVGAIVRNDLQEELQLQQNGKGTIDKQRAVGNLVESEFDGGEEINDEDKAAAVIDFFLEEGALMEDENGEIVVLHDPSELNDAESNIDAKREYQILNWAAAINACIDYMDNTLQTFEEAKKRIKDQLDDVDREDVSKAEQKKVEALQEMRNLGPGSQIPDPQELSPEEQSRFETLKNDIAYYETMEEVGEGELGAAQESIDQLARNIEKLEVAKEEYSNKVAEVRTWAMQEQVMPTEAMDIAKNMGEIMAAFTGVQDQEERAEEMDVSDLREMAAESLDQSQEAIEAVSETIEEPETTDIEMQ